MHSVLNPCIVSSQAAGGREATCTRQPACSEACGRLLEMWDPQLVLELSHHPKVQRVVPLGARPKPSRTQSPDEPLNILSPKQLVPELSHQPRVQRVVPLGECPEPWRALSPDEPLNLLGPKQLVLELSHSYVFMYKSST